MSALGRARAWLRVVVTRSRMEREMHEEMAAHIARAAERFVARGMSEGDALQAARREFGHLGGVQQHARDARGGQLADSLAGDLRYAFRYFARTPLTTIVIVLTLALGIGFSSATFSVITGILTRPPTGVPDDPALVKIRGKSNARPFARKLSYPELAAYAALTDKFASVAGWVIATVVVDAGDPDLSALAARAHFVTPNYFGTLGVGLAAGRGFIQSRFAELSPPELTAIVGHGFASERFGEPAAAVGKQVRVNDVLMTIVGVTRPGFNGATQSDDFRALWLPMSSWQLVAQVNDRVFSDPDAQRFEAVARLRPDVSLPEALPAVRVVAARADADARAQAERAWTASADVVRLRGVMDVTGLADDFRPTATLFGAIALLVLLVCTTTVNSLLVGAAIARRYEIGVRLALGASPRRLVRQLLTEISVLALVGGALGMWTLGALTGVVDAAKDGFDVSTDWTTTGFTLAYAVLTAVLCGLSPALHATRTGLADVLKGTSAGATSRSRAQRMFVVAQIAIAQPLMVALASALANVASSLPPTSNVALREEVLMAEFDTHAGVNSRGPDPIPRLVQRFAALPGVVSVLPMGYGQGAVSLQWPPANSLGGQPGAPPAITAVARDVPAGYFRAVDARILRGRELVASDTMSTVTPVILAESLAVALFGSSDPIGRRLQQVAPLDGKISEAEVVGVVRVERESSFLEHDWDFEVPSVFVPFRPRRTGLLLVRTSGPAERLIPTMMGIAREEARMLPVLRMRTLAHGDRLWRRDRLQAAGIAGGCGVVALILASIGLYAMVAVAVSQRRREIGIRLALGARARQVVAMFFTRGVRTTLMGLVLGLPLSAIALALLSSQAGMSGTDVSAVAVAVALTVVGVASLASWLPARQSAAVDPMAALRSE